MSIPSSAWTKSKVIEKLSERNILFIFLKFRVPNIPNIKHESLKFGSLNAYFSHICVVEFLNLAFSLGVVFAIFGFLWGILNMILTLLRGARPKTIGEEYLLKMVQYFFL